MNQISDIIFEWNIAGCPHFHFTLIGRGKFEICRPSWQQTQEGGNFAAFSPDIRLEIWPRFMERWNEGWPRNSVLDIRITIQRAYIWCKGFGALPIWRRQLDRPRAQWDRLGISQWQMGGRTAKADMELDALTSLYNHAEMEHRAEQYPVE